MSSRIIRGAAVMAAATAVSAAAADAAGPPPPVASSGAKVEQVAAGLGTPTSFAFGAGTVFEGDGGNSQSSGPPNGGVFALKNGAATKLAGSPNFVGGLAWRGGTLYLSGGTFTKSGPKWQLQAWKGWNGTAFSSRKVLYTAPKKFTGFNGIGFGADGRLYVGVSLPETGDHGPATTPYGYDILSFTKAGKGLKVVATGIRQPWQMAFPAHSSSPFVTDLSQDQPKGIKAPDFLMRVRKGQTYGFPSCNWVKPKACNGYAKPVRFFSPHSDVMGIAIVGKSMYLSEFGGSTKPQVVALAANGSGKAKTILSGFVAPIVGLGASGGYLYVGELTGQVFRIKL